MSKKMSQVEVELTAEEAEQLKQLFDSGNEEEIMCEVERFTKLAEMRAASNEVKMRLMMDTILCAAYMIEQEEPGPGLADLLVLVAEMLTARTFTMDKVARVFDILNTVNAQRTAAGRA